MTLLKLDALAALPVLADFVSQTPIENTKTTYQKQTTLLKLAALAALPVVAAFVSQTPIGNTKTKWQQQHDSIEASHSRPYLIFHFHVLNTNREYKNYLTAHRRTLLKLATLTVLPVLATFASQAPIENIRIK